MASDPASIILQRIERDIRDLRALIGAPESAPAAGRIPADLISLGEAAKLARRSKGRLREWCKDPANDLRKPGGFAVSIRGRWFVSASRFRTYLIAAVS